MKTSAGEVEIAVVRDRKNEIERHWLSMLNGLKNRFVDILCRQTAAVAERARRVKRVVMIAV